MAKNVKRADKSKAAFSNAASGKKPKKKLPWKLIIGGAVPLVALGGYFAFFSEVAAGKGNNLYGVCRGFIELNVQFPETIKVIEFDQRIPDGENPNSPQRINYDISFSSIDGFGQHLLNTLTCGFKFDQSLVNTPWQGILLERTQFNGSDNHGWADVYYPADKKDPRAADDRSEKLEVFYNTIPSFLVNPPDLTLPRYQLIRLSIERYKDL